MVLLKKENYNESTELTAAKKRRLRRKRSSVSKSKVKASETSNANTILTELPLEAQSLKDQDQLTTNQVAENNRLSIQSKDYKLNPKVPETQVKIDYGKVEKSTTKESVDKITNMSSKEPTKSREAILSAREAKKQSKLNTKNKDAASTTPSAGPQTPKKQQEKPQENKAASPKSKDEVDKAVIIQPEITEKSKDQIKAEREAKKLAKQAKKKAVDIKVPDTNVSKESVTQTIANIVEVAKEVQDVTAKVTKLLAKMKLSQPEESSKSKAELKAERRAKQEAQRAAKQAVQQPATKKAEIKPELKSDAATKKEAPKIVKTKTLEKSKSKAQVMSGLNWFDHLTYLTEEEALKKVPLNSHLHPAIIKLGVKLATRVVDGPNARCIALLDAMKKMISDYVQPAKSDFSRGLQQQMTLSEQFLKDMRPLSASQDNAFKFLRFHVARLPNNVKEFDAKKTLHEEIDRYIREQIDMAGEAISIAVRNKISNGETILTYGCSSLIERILVEAHSAGVQFSTVVCGERTDGGARDMMRRLHARGLRTFYVQLNALACVIGSVHKVLMGALALLSNGAVVVAAGGAAAARAARDVNVPVLVCAETHHFADTVHTDAFVSNELANPDDLVDKSDENCPLKNWRDNPNLTLLNLTYDITPPSLVTAVVTELAILPCTSAPVVLRFKLSEYGMQG